MQIRKIHDQHSRFQTTGQLHLKPVENDAGKQISASDRESDAATLHQTNDTNVISDLIEELRQLSESDEARIQLAQERFRSGELLTREAAEFVATSLLEDFNF